MENNVIAEKARKYIGKEDHPVFQDEISSLLKQENWKNGIL